jgi:hypothetical protein
MLRLIEERIAASDMEVRHKDALTRLRQLRKSLRTRRPKLRRTTTKPHKSLLVAQGFFDASGRETPLECSGWGAVIVACALERRGYGQ